MGYAQEAAGSRASRETVITIFSLRAEVEVLIFSCDHLTNGTPPVCSKEGAQLRTRVGIPRSVNNSFVNETVG